MSWVLLRNSFVVSMLTTVLAVSFGLIAALWVAGLKKRWQLGILAAAVLSLALPPFLVTNCWLDLLGHSGSWRHWLPLNIFSPGGTVWILTLLLWPITLFAVLSAWQRLEPSQLESDVAVSGWALIRALLIPLARISLGQAAVLTFVLALNNFAVPAILQVKVFPAEMWVRFSSTFDAAGALRSSWPLVGAPLLLVFWLSRQEFPWPRLEGPVPARLFRQQLGPSWFRVCGALTVLLCVLSVGLPVFNLITLKRTWTELPGALAAGESATRNSFLFAASAACLILGLALLFILPWAPLRTGSRLLRPLFVARFLGALAWLPFLLPGVLVGMTLIAIFNRPGLSSIYHSVWIVILAFTIRYFAFGWNSAAHALHAVDRDLLDDARLNGATRWQLFRSIQLPQIAPQAATAWYIVFLLCLWDVESMILVVPPGGEILSLRIFNLLHYGHNAQVNALCLILLATAMVPLLVWLMWRWLNPRRLLLARGVPAGIALVVPLVLLAGCVPSSNSGEDTLSSHEFSRSQLIGSRGVGAGQLNKPRSLALDKQDNLYVSDMTGRVQKFSAAGEFLLSWQMPQTDLGKPKGMTRDREGNIVVLEPHYQRVNHFSGDGKLLLQWGEKGTNAGQFLLPRAVAVSSQGEIYVSEYGTMERVQRFKPPLSLPGSPTLLPISKIEADGTGVVRFLGSFGRPGNGPGEFNRPEGLCVDRLDRIYVADSCNHRIQIFSADGKFLRAYGKAGTGKGELSYPYDICVDAAGHQYVCEFGNSRVQVFDANDHPLEIIGGPGPEPGRFGNPWGLALDSRENLYIADALNHRVQKLIRTQASPVKSAVSSDFEFALDLSLSFPLAGLPPGGR